jgi:hypothetical protein
VDPVDPVVWVVDPENGERLRCPNGHLVLGLKPLAIEVIQYTVSGTGWC